MQQLLHYEQTDYSMELKDIRRVLNLELISKGSIPSFSRLKKYDTIEIDDPESIVDEYDIASTSDRANLYNTLPFINEGVLKYSLIDEDGKRTIYNLFKVEEFNPEKKTSSIFLQTFHFFKSEYKKIFEVRICFIEKEDENLVAQLIHYKDHMGVLFELYGENPGVLTKGQQILWESYMQSYSHSTIPQETKKLCSDIVRVFNHCIILINEHINSQPHQESSKYKEKKKSDVIIPKEIVQNPKKKKEQVFYLGKFKIKKGENSQIRTRSGIIVRRTDVWNVIGHLRHYKSGKVIYIAPYKKGPGRNEHDPEKTTYKIKTKEGEN